MQTHFSFAGCFVVELHSVILANVSMALINPDNNDIKLDVPFYADAVQQNVI